MKNYLCPYQRLGFGKMNIAGSPKWQGIRI